MSELIRFGVSMERHLLEEFDRFIKTHGFTNRSEAIRDLIREKLALEKGVSTNNVIGTVTIVYNHHVRNLTEALTEIQHSYQKNILFSNHIHVTHEHCMEVIMVMGEEKVLRDFTNEIGGQRGVLMALPSFFTFDVENIEFKPPKIEEHRH